MNSGDHKQLHRDLGVYVLGALDPAERDQLEGHLATCQTCRDELAELAVLPSLLSRVADQHQPDDVQLPPVEAVLERIGTERRRSRRRERVFASVAALATLVAVVAVVVSAVAPNRTEGRVFAAAQGGPIATVEERAWGMAVHMQVPTLPPQRGYVAWAVSEDGHRTQLASWTAVDHDVEVVGSCYLAPSDVAHLEIVGADDDTTLAVLKPN